MTSNEFIIPQLWMCNEKNEIKATQTTLIDSNIIFLFPPWHCGSDKICLVRLEGKNPLSGLKDFDGWMVGEFDLPNYTPWNEQFAPANRPSQKETTIPTIHFQVRAVSFREGNWISKSMKQNVMFGVILTEMLHPKFSFQLGGLLEVQAENTLDTYTTFFSKYAKT